MPYVRVALFAFSACMFYLFLSAGNLWFALLAFGTFLLFLYAGIMDYKLKQLIDRTSNAIQLNQNELLALSGNYSPFNPGNEFINHNHPYSHDLDIFGEHSLFRMINRTSTPMGKKIMARYLGDAFTYSKDIKSRQEAIAELAANTDFRQNGQLVFFEQNPEAKDIDRMNAWLSEKPAIVFNYWFKALIYLLPAATLLAISLAGLGITSASVPVFLVILQLTIVFGFGRRIMKEHASIGSQYKIIQKYSRYLDLIEGTAFLSKLLQTHKNQLVADENVKPSAAIRKLASLLNWMDSNLNIIVAFFLNGMLMFNLHLLLRIAQWKVRFGNRIPVWFNIMGEFDALSSMANFTFNNPDFVFPEIVQGDFVLEGKEVGHPLIAKKECITNDFRINGYNRFCIITGANMSGKSTFLRTIGVNCILAMAGAPVFAKHFVFSPVRVHSSIRTSDSLARHESYFYAELKRLKEIIDELEKGNTSLILLDEILKGTNSRDKQTGSIALVKQLMRYKPVGLFATHDLMLGDLIKSYPDNIINLCFEISIADDKLEIDYKLREGVCSTLNASYLMQKMGILPPD